MEGDQESEHERIKGDQESEHEKMEGDQESEGVRRVTEK